MLRRRDIRDPKLLVVVTNNGEEVSRHLFGLFEEMRYLQFTKPGDNTVHATVVWPQKGENIDVVFFERYDSGSYKCMVVVSHQVHADELRQKYLDYAGVDGEERELLRNAWEAELEVEIATSAIRPEFSSANRIEPEARLTIAVDPKMFADEPNRLWKWFTELYPWDGKPRDQCQRRNRGLITLFTLPVSVPLVVLMRLGCWIVSIGAALLLLFAGRRNVNVSPVLHPVRMWPSEVWGALGPSVYFKVENPDGGYKDRTDVIWVVNPPVIAVCAVIGIVIWSLVGGLHWWLWVSILVATPLTFIGVALFCMMIGDLLGDSRASEHVSSKIHDKRAARAVRQEKRKKAALAEYERELELISCEAEPRVASLEAIPRERKTLVLRLEGVKAKVCKPYAR